MQLETPSDITLKADDAELARTTLLSAKGATCAAARNGETMITHERGVKPPPPMDFRGRKLRRLVCRRQGCGQSAGASVRAAQARCGLRDCHERGRT